MNEDERYAIYDKLPLLDMKIWPGDDEVEQFGKNVYEWADLLGHPKKSETHYCCKTCGCAITCMYGLFFDAMIETILRELDKLGHLRKTGTRSFSSLEEFEKAILDGDTHD